ncbi:acyl-CoA N-acyltransferase [Rickenella mellea]|uniref:Acyl-CoA N-acyltransferase n=1 Tax=Rickenella mellea TaxID=50990 RepID=A0A4Y7Q1D0_9AGAM|nr:acyl-CoA N-acyltransferase [Rickenella mellea]
MLPSNLKFELITANEVSDAHKLEVAGFPPDEAESLSRFQSRQSQAPELFLGAFLPQTLHDDSTPKGLEAGRRLIGYICASLSKSGKHTHASMLTHDLGGTSVCIHTVLVSSEYQRRGVAIAMLEDYIARLREANEVAGALKYARVLLLAHEETLGLYERAGFRCVGKSDVVYGSRPWYEFRKELADSPSPTAEPADAAFNNPPPGISEALQRSATGPRPNARPSSDVESVVEPGDGDTQTNKYDLLCPRNGCGSVILKRGVAELVEAPSVELEPTGYNPTSPLTPLEPPPAQMSWWLVKPSPMVFENIGFTRPVPQSQPSAGPKKKLLICAECELGPLGYCFEGGSEFWLAFNRVGYRE